MTYSISPKHLSIDEVAHIMSSGAHLELSPESVALIKQCRENTNGRCKGVFYWEPECKPSQYALGAFTEDGKPTVIMDAFNE